MKILHTISQFYMGGAQTLLLTIVEELVKRGIESEIICFQEENDFRNITDQLNYFSEIPCEVKLSIFRKNKYDLEIARKKIFSFKPDIIHSHLFQAELITRLINYPKASYFSHCHNNMPPFQNLTWRTLFNKDKALRFFEKQFLLKLYKRNKVNHFVAISKDTHNYFQESIPKKLSKITLLPNGFNYNRFVNKKPKTLTKNELILVTIGRLSENKNQIFFIDVVKKLKEKGINIQLNILGEGQNQLKIEEKLKEEGLINQVTFFQNITQVEYFLWDSHIYVHAALKEAFGLTILEAMAAGLPVVTLDGKGNRDLIEEGKNGFMIFQRDSDKFVEKILKLYNNQQLYHEMSNYAKEYAKQYDIKSYVDQLLNLYQDALSNR